MNKDTTFDYNRANQLISRVVDQNEGKGGDRYNCDLKSLNDYFLELTS